MDTPAESSRGKRKDGMSNPRDQSTGIAAFLKALKFAADKHSTQRRKGYEASPYINHLIEVAEILSRVGRITDPVTLQAAILHDTIEDTTTTAEELESHFGTEVLSLIEELTDDKSLPKPERKRLQIEQAPHLSIRAKQIKIADKISNVRDVTHFPPSHWPWQRRLDYLDWAEQVVAGLRGCNPQIEELFDAILHDGRQIILGQRPR